MLIVGLPFIFSACIDSPEVEDPNVRLQSDLAAIDSYLTAQGLTSVKSPYIRMVITKLGDQLPAIFGTTVKVKYKGTLFTTGATFDENNTSYTVAPNPANNNQWDVIEGWKVALTTLPEGSKAKIYIPSGLAYGTNGRGTIPGNAILVFEIEILDVVSPESYFTKLGSDTVAIDKYLSEKLPSPILAQKDTSGIRFVFTTDVAGSNATWYNKLKVKFTYKSIIDDTKVLIAVDQEPSEFFFSRPVDYPNGLKVGLQKMSKGDKATFYIPSGLGYGPTGAYSGNTKVIPDNTNLIVEVELTDITQ